MDHALIGIYSDMGHRVCTVATHLAPNFDGKITGRGILLCRLPAVPLRKGEYVAMPQIGTATPLTWIDYVVGALWFRVKEGDYFGTGKSLRGTNFFAQHSFWQVIQWLEKTECSELSRSKL